MYWLAWEQTNRISNIELLLQLFFHCSHFERYKNWGEWSRTCVFLLTTLFPQTEIGTSSPLWDWIILGIRLTLNRQCNCTSHISLRNAMHSSKSLIALSIPCSYSYPFFFLHVEFKESVIMSYIALRVRQGTCIFLYSTFHYSLPRHLSYWVLRGSFQTIY